MKYRVGDKVQLIKDANQGQVKAGEIGKIIDCNEVSIDILTGIITRAGFTVDFTNVKNVFFTDIVIDESLVIDNIAEQITKIEREAALYLWRNSDEANISDCITQDIDFTGCNPIIAEALKQNKSILCKTNCGDEQNITHYKKSNCPYVDEFGDQYDSAEPIKKKDKNPTFEGHALREGMVFEHESGDRYIICKDASGEWYLKAHLSLPAHYGVWSKNISKIFEGNAYLFKLISVPVEKGKIYKVGDRFIDEGYGQEEYILTEPAKDRFVLIQVKTGERYLEISGIERIFDGDEEDFSLLVSNS
jgi:hypothetical protein